MRENGHPERLGEEIRFAENLDSLLENYLSNGVDPDFMGFALTATGAHMLMCACSREDTRSLLKEAVESAYTLYMRNRKYE